MTVLPLPALAFAKWPLEAAQSTSSGGTTPWLSVADSSEQPVISASSLDEGFGASGQRQLVLGVADEDAGVFFEAYGSADSPVVTVVRRG